MQTILLSMLKPEFSFAGFTFPRYVARIPRGSLRQRLADRRPVRCGEYYHAPKPNANNGRGFYLQSESMPGLRWEWCDEVSGARISHTGWFCDEDQSDKIRGIVFRLPNGRGFLAGWSMGKHMSSAVDPEIFETAEEAAYAADSAAETAADSQREHNERFRDMTDAESTAEEKREALAKALALRHNPRFGGMDAACEALQEYREALQDLADKTAAYERG